MTSISGPVSSRASRAGMLLPTALASSTLGSVNARQQLRTAARWRCAPIPDGFGTDAYPTPVLAAVIKLPLELDWSWDTEPNDWDTTTDKTLARLYSRVLEVGTAEHVIGFIDPARLEALWDEHWWTGAVEETWQPWIDAYRAERAD